LLVHGLGMTRAMWDRQWPALAGRFRVLRYDLLGHGESDKPRDGYSLARFADQAAGLMDGLGIERAALVGFSLGGMIVRAFALAHPGRTAALAILNSAHDRTAAERDAVLLRVAQAAKEGPRATVAAALERWFTPDYGANHPEVLDRVRGWILANDPAVYPLCYRVLAEGDRELAEAIAAIRAPTLVMTGGEDQGNTPDMARRMAALIPGARLEIVPGLRHMGLYQQPAAFNGPLLDFLDEALGTDP
ncbi:MAG: alpha/beta fold hydrolase, partial [Kiloniellales bacterium]|nr:alpha/beta fold hydrolase [Kiloniellales bacterium]